MSQLKSNIRYHFSALILCAGEGSRFKGASNEGPKSLLKIESLNHASILQHTVSQLVECGIKRIILVKGHMGYKIEEFATESIRKDRNLKDILTILDASKDYLKGPLYSFLSLIKNKDFFVKDYIYFIIPGDTIFSPSFFDKILDKAEKAIIKRNQSIPIVFYQKVTTDELIKNHETSLKESKKSISGIRVKRRPFKKYILEIYSFELNQSLKNKNIKQIVPIFLFPYEFIKLLSELEHHGSFKTIREVVNVAIFKKNILLALKVKNQYNFHDIDSEFDLKDFEKRII